MSKFFFFVLFVATCLSGCATGGTKSSADIDRESRHQEYNRQMDRDIQKTINSVPSYQYTPAPMPTYNPPPIR